MRFFLVTIVAVGLYSSTVQSAEVVLREVAVASGPVVRLGDVADIAAADADELDELVTTPLMPAPAAGSRQFLTAAQVLDLLAARGIDTSRFEITGSSAVAIGDEQTALANAAAEGSSSTAHLAGRDRAQVVAAATAAITDFLRSQTGRQTWKVDVEPTPQLVASLRTVEAKSLAVRGGRPPFTGQQRFELSTATGRTASAFVHVDQVAMLAFASRAIERGNLVRAVDVEIRPYSGDIPTTALTDLAAAIGKEAVQSIRTDALLLASQLRSPTVVHRGERVEITARAAGVSVRTFASASQDGSVGDLVMVESLTGRERYAARVTGAQQLEVYASSPTVEDLSARR